MTWFTTLAFSLIRPAAWPGKKIENTFADPKSFVRGGPNLKSFFFLFTVDGGGGG